jgi:hypothetical protein
MQYAKKDTRLDDYLVTLDSKRQADGKILIDLFEEVTSHPSVLWGDSIIGYGEYHYKYESGLEGDSSIVAFSPRKAKLSIYLYLPEEERERWLKRLGKCTSGKLCIYVNQLKDIDLDVLRHMIKRSWEAVLELYPEHG